MGTILTIPITGLNGVERCLTCVSVKEVKTHPTGLPRLAAAGSGMRGAGLVGPGSGR